MTSKKKNKQKKQSTTSQNSGLLGGKLNGIAVALLTALVTEIVQQVLDRLFASNPQHHSTDATSAPAAHNSPEAAEPKPVAAAVEDRLPAVKPLMQDVLKAVQTTVQEAAPKLNQAIAVLKASSNDPQQAVATLVRDAVNSTKDNLNTATAAPNLEGWISSALSVTQSAIDTMAAPSPEVSEEKGKKKKGKKKNKKNKKN